MTPEPQQGQDRLVIDIGCGSPERRRSKRRPSAIGVDIDPLTLRTPRGRAGHWRSVCADARHLPFRSSSCDLVMLDAVLHHLAPIDHTMCELVRVLRPGGQVRITDGVALAPQDAAALDRELLAAGLPGEPIYGFDLRDLTELAASNGLHVEQLDIGGTATFATPPFVSRVYSSERFSLTARRR